MNVARYIAQRYFFSRSGNRAVNMLSLVSMLGIMVGTGALFVVLAAFSGLENFIMQGRRTMDPGLRVEVAQGKHLEMKAKNFAALRAVKGVKQAAEMLETKVFIQRGDKSYIALARGVDASYSQVIPIASAMRRGAFISDFKGRAVVVDPVVAQHLVVDVNDAYTPLQLLVPKPGRGQIGDLKNAFYSVNAHLKGVFVSKNQTDQRYIITPLALLQALLHYGPNDISAVAVALKPGADQAAVKGRLESLLGARWRILTRKEQHAAFYKIMNTENKAAYFIFALILIIATFSVAASVVMLIIEKRQDLKTLRNLGLQMGKVKRIIIYEGLLVSLSGGLGGLLLGIGLTLAQRRFQLVHIESGLNAIAYPLALRLEDVATVMLTVLFLAVVCCCVSSMGLKKKFLER